MDERYNTGSSPFAGLPASSTTTIRPDVVEPSSPEDDTNLKESLYIDMKGLMGDAVGNVSLDLLTNCLALTSAMC